MKNKQILFFATKDDIEPIMKTIEKINQIKYYEMGMFDIYSSSFYDSVFEISDFAIPKYGDWNLS